MTLLRSLTARSKHIQFYEEQQYQRRKPCFPRGNSVLLYYYYIFPSKWVPFSVSCYDFSLPVTFDRKWESSMKESRPTREQINYDAPTQGFRFFSYINDNTDSFQRTLPAPLHRDYRGEKNSLWKQATISKVSKELCIWLFDRNIFKYFSRLKIMFDSFYQVHCQKARFPFHPDIARNYSLVYPLRKAQYYISNLFDILPPLPTTPKKVKLRINTCPADLCSEVTAEGSSSKQAHFPRLESEEVLQTR